MATPQAAPQQKLTLHISDLMEQLKGHPLRTGALLGGSAFCGLLAVLGMAGLGLLLLGIAIFAIIVARNPELGVLAIVGVLYLLPFGVVPVAVAGLHPTFLDIAISTTLAIWVLKLRIGTRQDLVLSPMAVPVLLLLGVALAALLAGSAPVSQERFRLLLKLLNSILLFFTVLNCLRSPATVTRTAQAVVLGAGLSAAIAITLSTLPAGTGSQLLAALGPLGYPTDVTVLRYVAGTETLRATGTAIDPNVLGGMLIIALPLAMGQLLGARSLPGRIAPGAVVLLVAWALLLTYSRGAWIAAVVGLSFMAAFRYRTVWLLLGGAIGLVLLLPQGDLFVQRFESGLFLADPAVQMRLGEYKDALQLIARYPILGVGFGEAPAPHLYVGASSIYLLVAEQMGLVGLGALLVALGVLFWTVLRGRRAAGALGLQDIQMGALGGVAGALCAGLFDHYFFNPQFPHAAALLWLVIGLAIAATVASRREAGVTSGG